ncbi:unnamed protein product [marine sediment metagenome]|uniref:Uncharacterized protein n=1 Tax=marine sediment metagenome TaxID=412755 RepID=X0SSN4_9ZZZZ
MQDLIDIPGKSNQHEQKHAFSPEHLFKDTGLPFINNKGAYGQKRDYKYNRTLGHETQSHKEIKKKVILANKE